MDGTAGSVHAGAGAGMPVAVVMAGRMGEEITRYVEGALAWRRVPLEGPPRPRLVLAHSVIGGLPTVVVVSVHAPQSTRSSALAQGALEVVRWPEERARLAVCATKLRAPSASREPAVLRVGGVARGCGASTVALAVGAVSAWAGRRTVVVGGEGLLRLAGAAPWRGPALADLARLPADEAAEEVGRLMRAAPAVPGLWLLAGAPPLPPPAGWPVGLVVSDVGVAAPEAADLLVAPGALGTPSPGGGVRLLAPLPHSARVARAGSAGRVPAGLPGTFLAALRGGLR